MNQPSLLSEALSGLFLLGLIIGIALVIAFLPELQDRVRRWWRDVAGPLP